MARIQSIITRARDTLADPTGARWDDARLLRLVDEGYKDICRRAKLLRASTSFPLYDGDVLHTIDDLLLLDRVLYDEYQLEFIDHSRLDDIEYRWEEDKGQPYYVVYDKQKRQNFKLYPIPEGITPTIYTNTAGEYIEEENYTIVGDYGLVGTVEEYEANQDYGIIADIQFVVFNFTEPYLQSSNYGFFSHITCMNVICNAFPIILESNPVYGIIVALDNIQTSVYGLSDTFVNFDNLSYTSNYGITTDVDFSDKELTVYYIQQPETITSLTSELMIDPIFDSALKYYVTGKALRDSMDTQNRQAGSEELAFYDRELREALKDDSIDFTRNDNKQFTTPYTGGLGDGVRQNYSSGFSRYRRFTCKF